MTELETLRDKLKEHAAAHAELLAAVEAAIARVPTIADVQALVARVAAGA
jgi:hypothetical protein